MASLKKLWMLVRNILLLLHIDISQEEAQIQAMLWCQIGWTWYDMGNIVKAREYYGRAEQILVETDVLAGTVWATIRLRQSYVSWREGNYENARLTAQDALTLFEEALRQQKHSVEGCLSFDTY